MRRREYNRPLRVKTYYFYPEIKTGGKRKGRKGGVKCSWKKNWIQLTDRLTEGENTI